MKENLLPVSILVAAFIIGGSLIYTAGVQSPNSQASIVDTFGNTTAPGAETPTIVNVSADDDVMVGDPNAPVTMIVFGDYQCPFCKRAYDEAERQVREEYVSKGLVKMVYRDFPLDMLHPFAREAAEAAECARDQGKYWMYHDALFERQEEIGKTLDYVALAKELGMNEGTFKTCVETDKYDAEVEKDYQDGVAAGVTGTPSSFINGKIIPGAVPYATYKAEIEAALANESK